MVALLVGMVALLLAIIVSALLDPSPVRKDQAGDDLYSTEEPVPAVLTA